MTNMTKNDREFSRSATRKPDSSLIHHQAEVRRRRLARACAAAVFLAGGVSAHAATSAWTTGNGDGSGNWSVPANWGGTAPVSGNALSFSTTTGVTTLTDNLTTGASNWTVGGVTFVSGAAAYTINAGTVGGNPSGFTLTGGISDAATNSETITDNITLSGNQTFQVSGSSGALMMGSTVSGSGVTLTTNAAGGTSTTSDLSQNTIFTGTVTLASLLADGPSSGNPSGVNTGAAGSYAVEPTTTFNGSSSLTTTSNVYVGRGNVVVTGSTVANIGGVLGTNNDWASLTISGNANVTATGGVSMTGTTTATGQLNLNGGTLTTSGIAGLGENGAGFGGPGIYTYFNGTQIDATGNNSTFVAIVASTITAGDGTTNALIGNGGLLINSEGYNIGIAANLVNSTSTFTTGAATGFLTKTGLGTLALTGANTYTGTTTASGGTLQIGNGTSGNISNSSASTVGTSGTLAFDMATASSYTGSISNSGVVAGVEGSGITNTLGGAISGSGVLNQTGAGTTILSVANTLSGQTTISAGAVQLGNTTALQNSIVSIGVTNGLTFTSGIHNFTVGGLAGASNESLLDTASTAVNLTVGNNNNTGMTYSGNLIGTGATITKIGSGIQILSGADTYTGNTTISSGTLILSGSNNNGATATTTVDNGGTLQLQANSGNTSAGVSSALGTASGNLNLNSGSTLQLRGNTGGTTFSGGDSLGAVGNATVTIDVNNNGSGSGNALDFATTSGFNVFNTTLNVTGGNGYGLAVGTLTDIASSGTSTDTFNPTTANLSISGLAGSGAGTHAFILGGTSTGNAVTGAISNVSGTTAITKSNTSTWTLAAASSYTGATTVNSGTLKLDFTASGAPATNIISSGSALKLGGGTLQILGASGGSSQTFNGTAIQTGGNTFNAAPVSGTIPTVALGTLTGAQGSLVVFNGPAYNSGASSGTTLGGSTQTATAAITATSITVGGGLISNSTLGDNGAGAYATVGSYDWAAISTGAAGSATAGTIVGGSQISGFYTTTGTIPTGFVGNIDLTGNSSFSSSTLSSYQTMRFNANSAYTVTTGSYAIVGGLLVTPNVGANNVTISGTASLQASENSSAATGLTVWQNNTSGELIISAPYSNGTGAAVTASYTQGGPGMVLLSGLNTYTGQTYLDGGTTVITAFSGLGGGSAPSTLAALNLGGGTLVGNATSVSTDYTAGSVLRAVALNPSGGGLAATSGSTLTVGGVISGNGPLTIGTGTLAGSGGALVGSGTVALTNAETYTGSTTISGSSMLSLSASSTNNISSSKAISIGTGSTLNVTSLNSGQIVLASGQALGGSGTVSGGTVVGSGSTISAGTSTALGTGATNTTGTLTTGNETRSSGGTNTVKINNVTGTSGNASGWDDISMATLNSSTLGSSTTFAITLTSAGAAAANFTNTSNYTWPIASIATGSLLVNSYLAVTNSLGSSTGTTSSSLFTLDTSGFVASNPVASGSYFYLEAVGTVGSGETLDIGYYSAAPEPGTAMLVLAGALPMLTGRRRRKNRRDSALPVVRAEGAGGSDAC